MSKLGGMAGLMDKLPGMGQVPDHVKSQVNDKEVVKLIAIVDSMTPMERQHPQIIKGSAQAHRHGLRHPGAGREQAAEAVHADAEDDEEDEGRQHGQDDAPDAGPAAAGHGISADRAAGRFLRSAGAG
jgi:hypothetical protein